MNTAQNMPCRLYYPLIVRDQIIFDRYISLDLVWTNVNLVLDFVETETGFQNAVFIRNKLAESLWNEFINCWADIYSFSAEIIKWDRETTVT